MDLCDASGTWGFFLKCLIASCRAIIRQKELHKRFFYAASLVGLMPPLLWFISDQDFLR